MTPEGRTIDVDRPADGARIARVGAADAALVDRAVTAATAAAETWAATSLTARTRTMFAFRELVERHASELAAIITAEHGKTLDDARGEVTRGREVIDFACGLAQLLKGEISQDVSRGIDAYALRQPLGVMAGITPFNFPVMVPLWMAPMAIACGNAFILKPSERVPSASVRLAELLSEAGAPDGVLNVVHGDREAVDAILAHPGIAGVSFVGSTPVARHVHRTASEAGKRVQALGGAKNHAVVLPDADLGVAADAIVGGAFGSAGQRCMAVSVAVAVGDETADALVARIAETARGLRVGPGDAEGTDVGPVITAASRDRIVGLVDAGVAQGAKLVVDGRGVAVDGAPEGWYVGPCLLDRVTPGMDVYDEEVFGPVLSVVRAGTYAEALDLVNANPYGNGASVFTSDGLAARSFERDVTAGMVGVNVPVPVPTAPYSFGGWKDSLFGDLHIHGPDAIRFCTRGKVVTRRWPLSTDAAVQLGFPTQT